ncbi:MAG: hypothetical protein WC139_08650 [Candidatus Kapaibacterium sp.]
MHTYLHDVTRATNKEKVLQQSAQRTQREDIDFERFIDFSAKIAMVAN